MGLSEDLRGQTVSTGRPGGASSKLCSFCGGFLVCRGQYPSKVVQGGTTGKLVIG